MSFLRSEYAKLAGKSISLDLNQPEAESEPDENEYFEPIPPIKRIKQLSTFAKEVLTDWFNANIEVNL